MLLLLAVIVGGVVLLLEMRVLVIAGRQAGHGDAVEVDEK
jgi:hypothetical protein